MGVVHRAVATSLMVTASLALAVPASAQQAPPGTFDAVRNLCLALAFGQEQKDIVLTTAQRDVFGRCSEMVGSRETGAPAASVALAREEIAAAGSALTETAVSQLANVQGRVVQLHRGARGLSVAGLTLDEPELPSSTGVRLAALGDVERYLVATVDQQDAGGGSDPAVYAEPWGFFVSGHYASGDRDNTDLEPGYDFDSYDVTAGIDRRVGRSGFFGLAGGLSASGSDLTSSELNPAASGGTFDVDGTSLSLYTGAGLADAWLVDASVVLTSQDFESHIPVRYDIAGHPVSQIALAETEGDELVVSGGITYDRASGGFSFQPSLRVTWTDATVDGYTESFVNGPGSAIDPVTNMPYGFGLALAVGDQDIESLISTLGATLAWNVSNSWGVFIPQLRFDWMHEFEDDPRAIVTRFAATPDNIAELLPLVPGGPTDPSAVNLTVFTNEPDRDYFNIGAGFQAVAAGGTQFFLIVETVQDLDNVSSYGGTAGIRFAF